VNSAMHHGVQEVPSTGAIPAGGYGAKAGASAPSGVSPAAESAIVDSVNPGEFFPDGVTVPGPMSLQVARKFPGGTPTPLAPMGSKRPLLPAPVVPTGAPGLVCPGCSASLEAGSRFCGECGFRLEVRITACHLCGAPLEPNAR